MCKCQHVNTTVSSYGSTEVAVCLTHLVGMERQVQQGKQDPEARAQVELELHEIK